MQKYFAKPTNRNHSSYGRTVELRNISITIGEVGENTMIRRDYICV
jgi:hypothetical protein